MKLNQKEIAIQQYVFEITSNEAILYAEKEKIVLVLNNTALAVLNAIKDAAEKKRDTTTEEIAELLCEQYSVGKEEFKEVCRDVDSTVKSLFDAELFQLI